MTDTKDYLAIILLGGGSSWARGPDAEKAITDVTKQVKSDWGRLFNLEGVEVRVNLWDITGNDVVYWDDCGMHADNQEQFPITKVETRIITLPGKRKVVA